MINQLSLITVALVKNGNKAVMFYAYDDHEQVYRSGFYDDAGTLIKYRFYIRDVSGNVLAVYDLPPVGEGELIEMPIYGASRIGIYKPSGKNGYFHYEMTDHLGNVRAVCAQPVSTIYPTVTFETDTEEEAEENFRNYSSINNPDADHTDAGTVYNRVQTLNGGDVPQGRVGLAKDLEVSPGDEISISAYATYRVFTGDNHTPLINGLASAFGVSAGSTGEQLTLYNSLAGFASTVIDGVHPCDDEHPCDDDNPPRMFVTILLFDKNYNLLDATWDQVSGDGAMPPTGPATSYAHVSASYKVKQQGYAYLFISNEHPVNAEAYFDDVTVTHTESPIVAGSDYYPFGLPLDGTEITDEPYRYGYQGQYSEKDSLTGWNQFELRMYDARFGRWISPDPYGQFASPYVGMGNNPVSGTDPDGGMCCLGYDAVAASMALEQAIGPASATLLDEVVVTASRLGGAGLWYAKDIGNFFLNKDGRFSAEFEKDFGGATELAASIDRGFYGFNVNWNGGYNEFAVKLGFTANVALTMGEMSAPNPMAMAVTPSGNVPVTMPVTVPITTVLVHGMLLSSTPAAASETPKPNGLKKFSSKWLPDVPIKAQLKGQLGKLLKRFNVEGYSIEDLVEMTPRQVEEAIKGLPNSSQVFQQLNKALQDGGHYF